MIETTMDTRGTVAHLAVDLPDFHEKYRVLEQAGKVDSAGGQEWRRLLADCIRRWMDSSVDLSVEALEEMVWYIQKTQWSLDSGALGAALRAGSPE